MKSQHSRKDFWNNVQITRMRQRGYNGPVKYDKDGNVINITVGEIQKYNKQRHQINYSLAP